MKQQNRSLYIAILALIVSSISLYLSFQNREHDRLVSFEQRKQEVRQLSLEGEILSGKLEGAILEHIRTDKTPEKREVLDNILKNVKESSQKIKANVADLEALPATSRTDARIKLETLLTNQQHINIQLLEFIEKVKQLHGANHKVNRF